MATVYHTYKQPRATKKWNDKDAANLPASVMRGYNVTSTVDAVDSTKYNVVVSGDAEGAGWYSSLRLPNGILIEEVVEEIATFVVQPTGAFPIWSYSLIVCRCPWSADEFLQPTYERIAIASFDAETDETLAVIASYPAGGVSVLAFPMTPGAINWPMDRIQSLRGVKQKLSVDFSTPSLPSGANTIVRGYVCAPHGFQYYTLPDDTAPVAHLRVTAWAYLLNNPGAGDAVHCRASIKLVWDPQDGTGPVAYAADGAYETTDIAVYALFEVCKIYADIDLSAVFSAIPVGTVVPADAVFCVSFRRQGLDAADTFSGEIEVAAVSLEVVQTKPGEAF